MQASQRLQLGHGLRPWIGKGTGEVVTVKSDWLQLGHGLRPWIGLLVTVGVIVFVTLLQLGHGLRPWIGLCKLGFLVGQVAASIGPRLETVDW